MTVHLNLTEYLEANSDIGRVDYLRQATTALMAAKASDTTYGVMRPLDPELTRAKRNFLSYQRTAKATKPKGKAWTPKKPRNRK